MRGLHQWFSELSRITWKAGLHAHCRAPPQSFRSSRSGVGTENWHFYHFQERVVMLAQAYTLRTTGLDIQQCGLVVRALRGPRP